MYVMLCTLFKLHVYRLFYGSEGIEWRGGEVDLYGFIKKVGIGIMDGSAVSRDMM